MIEEMLASIMAAIGGLYVLSFRNHGCIKKLEGQMKEHLKNG